MAVRRNTDKRLTIQRQCHTCGKWIFTTAASPFMRQMPNVNGKKQSIVYFCSKGCKEKSYKHKFDGMADVRRQEREKNRDYTEKNKKYYYSHYDELREKRIKKYWENHEEMLENLRYQRQKRKLLETEATT